MAKLKKNEVVTKAAEGDGGAGMAQPLAASAPDPALSRWDFAITTPFANEGDYANIPETTLSEDLNVATGFTKAYAQALEEGGKAVPREGMNGIFNRVEKALQEVQGKTPQIRKAVTEEGFDYTLTYMPTGDVVLNLWGAKDIPAGSGSAAQGNNITVKLPYTCVSEHSGYSLMLRPPASAAQQAVGWIVAQTSTSVTFKTPLYSATEPIHYHINLTLLGDIGAYPNVPQNLRITYEGNRRPYLHWEAPTGGAEAVSYNIYSSAYAESGFTLRENITHLYWQDIQTVTSAQMRYYKIAAVSAAGEGFFTPPALGYILLNPTTAPIATVKLNRATIKFNPAPSFAQTIIEQSFNGGAWTQAGKVAGGTSSLALTLSTGTYFFRYKYVIDNVVEMDYSGNSNPIYSSAAPYQLAGSSNGIYKSNNGGQNWWLV